MCAVTILFRCVHIVNVLIEELRIAAHQCSHSIQATVSVVIAGGFQRLGVVSRPGWPGLADDKAAGYTAMVYDRFDQPATRH